MKKYNITVWGRVQGVYYRANTKKKAEEIGILGFVRNQEDGSVYIEAEGDDQQLQEFLTWCQNGPEGAKVIELKTQESPLKGFSTFTILYD
ncbi:MAG: acylphosphatase [bacterium]